MPQAGRIQDEGAIIPVMGGNRRERIFAGSSGRDEEPVLQTPEDCCARTGFRVWARVRMDNDSLFF